MQRVATLFSVLAVVILLFGMAAPRIVPNLFMSLNLKSVGYAIPYSAVCFGMGFLLSLFAFLYSVVWMVRWSTGAGWWHFGLSVAVLTGFVGCLVSSSLKHEQLGRPLPVTATLILAPAVFALVQMGFGVDALRRCLLQLWSH